MKHDLIDKQYLQKIIDFFLIIYFRPENFRLGINQIIITGHVDRLASRSLVIINSKYYNFKQINANVFVESISNEVFGYLSVETMKYDYYNNDNNT